MAAGWTLQVNVVGGRYSWTLHWVRDPTIQNLQQIRHDRAGQRSRRVLFYRQTPAVSIYNARDRRQTSGTGLPTTVLVCSRKTEPGGDFRSCGTFISTISSKIRVKCYLVVSKYTKALLKHSHCMFLSSEAYTGMHKSQNTTLGAPEISWNTHPQQ